MQVYFELLALNDGRLIEILFQPHYISMLLFVKSYFFSISFRILPVNKTRTLTPGLTHTAIGDLDMIEHEL